MYGGRIQFKIKLRLTFSKIYKQFVSLDVADVKVRILLYTKETKKEIKEFNENVQRLKLVTSCPLVLFMKVAGGCSRELLLRVIN